MTKANETIKIPRLLQLYRESIAPELTKDLNLTNILAAPKIEKIVINVGLGEALVNSKALEHCIKDISLITGQKPITTKAKSSIAQFKIREGMAIGVATTLRGHRMYEFLDRLINLSLPRVRDFRGLTNKSFDGNGNYTLGIKEQIVFPEINYDKVEKIRGMNVIICTTAETDEEGLELLKGFNRGEISEDEKINATRIDGFRYVIDAFHVVGAKDVPVRFFYDERDSLSPGIRLTDELFRMTSAVESDDLLKENESRWRLVETAWGYNIPQRLITVDYDEKLESFFAIDSQERRHGVTSAGPALNGYQRGKCFYCNRQIHIETWTLREERAEVDHFFPHVLQRKGDIDVDLDQAWNLVLACNKCNGGSDERRFDCFESYG